MRSRIYISGPMTGLPENNYPAFNAAAKELRARGYIVYNPAENFGGAQDAPREEYMRLDMSAVLQADCIALLPGWQGSKGAVLEVEMANELGLLVCDWNWYTNGEKK